MNCIIRDLHDGAQVDAGPRRGEAAAEREVGVEATGARTGGGETWVEDEVLCSGCAGLGTGHGWQRRPVAPANDVPAAGKTPRAPLHIVNGGRI